MYTVTRWVRRVCKQWCKVDDENVPTKKVIKILQYTSIHISSIKVISTLRCNSRTDGQTDRNVTFVHALRVYNM